nr:hypothetical protein [uncultured Eubacterium sp.]
MEGRIKIFGFRTGAAYKMIPAILYYAFMAFYIVTGIYGELKYYSFETMDYVLMVFKYVFFIILFFSPLIFLSDFKYRDKLPLFKKRQLGSTIIGLLLVWMFCYFMTSVDLMCMSDTWKKSRDSYNEKLRIEREKKLKEMETTTIGESEKVTYDITNNKVIIMEGVKHV